MIRTNMEYVKDKKHWVTSYPWLVDPSELLDNHASALATLQSTEKSLSMDSEEAASYRGQIQDMVNRGAARNLTSEESEQWQGPKFYICHLALMNPKSNNTPVCIVFNSSQTYKGVSLNNCLAKGPDSYANSGLGILLRWREQPVAVVGASREINEAAAKLGTQHDLEWIVGPADSPWHQGAVEALV